VRALSTLGDIVGFNSASAVMFNDPVSGTRTLASLKLRRGIFAAGMYSESGQLFAHWENTPKTPEFPLPEKHDKETHQFQHGTLVLFHPVIFDQARIGTLYIASDLYELHARVKRYATITTAVLCVSVIVAVIISFGVGKRISE